jgi:hypothetical protein
LFCKPKGDKQETREVDVVMQTDGSEDGDSSIILARIKREGFDESDV